MSVARFFRRARAGGRTRFTSSRKLSLHIEPLETRALLSASSLLNELTAQPLSFSAFAGVNNTTPRGYTPSQISRAYEFDQISFKNGTVKGDGRGQTIAIVAAYDHPNIYADLQVFNRTFGLPDPPSFRKINQYGGTAMPAVNGLWAQEIALDVEWAHAMAPAANILLVEANTASLSDLMTAVNTARNTPGVSVVSMSWGTGEFASQVQFDETFTTPAGHVPITFIAAAGDSGAQAVWPAISPNVIAVGGTSLSASSGGYIRESAWSGSGGGYSKLVAEPSYQRSVQSTGARSSPDVSYVASPNTGVAIYDSVGIYGRRGWFQIGGTSAGAPQWAALVAIVDQGRTLAGQPLLGDGHAALYSLASTSFHDVTVGSNGNRATAGYDLVTGRGTPIANAIARNLVTTSTVGATTTAPTSTPKPAPAPAPIQYRYQLVYSNRRWHIVRVVASAMSDRAGQTVTSVASLAPVSAIKRDAVPTESIGPATQTAVQPQTQASAAPTMGPAMSSRRAGSKLMPRHADEEPRSDSLPSDEDNATDSGGQRGSDSGVPSRDHEIPSQSPDAANPPADSQPRFQPGGLELPATATFLEPGVVDMCLEPVDFSQVDEPLDALGDYVAWRWEADLAMLAVGLAAVVYRDGRPALGREPRRFSRPRICRLTRD